MTAIATLTVPDASIVTRRPTIRDIAFASAAEHIFSADCGKHPDDAERFVYAVHRQIVFCRGTSTSAIVAKMRAGTHVATVGCIMRAMDALVREGLANYTPDGMILASSACTRTKV